MTQDHGVDERTRRRVAWTAAALALLAIGFYVGFILMTAAKT